MSHKFDSASKTWISRFPAPVFDPNANLGQLILDVLARNPQNVLQIDADTSTELTAGEMRLRAIRVAQNLIELGFRNDDMAAVVCSNSENLAPLVLGLWLVGIPFISLPVGFNGDDLGHLMGLVQPRLVICDDGVYKVVLEGTRKALKMKPVVFAVESELESIRKAEELLQETGKEQEFEPQYFGDMRELIGIILCTSGTTGRPKGVCVSQAHISVVLGRPVARENSNKVFNFSPLYWGTGLFALLNSISTGTTRVVTRSGFNEDVFFDVLDRYRPTHFFTPPSHAILLLEHPGVEQADFGCLKSWSLSGSHASPELRKRIESKIRNENTFNSYASSEIGLIAMDMMKKKKEGSVGSLMPHLNAKVVDERREAVGVGEQGELLLKTTIPFMGYYDDEEANRELLDEDGWVRTGDIGYLDEEGFIYLVDRKKDVIKYRGFQMSPMELEAVIEKIDGVREVCVVGIPEMDGSSDLAAAVIVKREGCALTEEHVVKLFDEQVSDHKRLRGGVFFWKELPLTPTGKVLRREVKKRLIEANQLE